MCRAMDNIAAREGMEQRIVPAGMAARGNRFYSIIIGIHLPSAGWKKNV